MQTPSLNNAANIGSDAAISQLQARADRVAGADTSGAEEAEAAGRELEALFATLLVKEMRRALPNEGFFGEGTGADTFNGWMDDFMGQQLADAGALELAGMVKAALLDEAPPSDQTPAPEGSDEEAKR